MATRTELAKWLTPEISELQMDALWGRIESAGGGRGARVRWALGLGLAGGAVVVAAAAVALLVWLPRSLTPGEALLTAERPIQGRFSDGSTVQLARASEVELLEDTPAHVRVRLQRGKAAFEVAKRPSRSFQVEAGAVKVSVVGTQFTVLRDGEHVHVSVDRGVVDVGMSGHTARLTAGGSWDSGEVEEAALAPAPPVREPAPVPMPAPVPPASPALRQRPTRSVHSHGAGTVAPTVAEADPDTLFQAALTARREARAADAALAFERFLRDHMNDSRAPLAAFELGRLRMGQLADEQGAVESFELSLRLSPDAPFAEEALSRLVRAYDGLHDTAACVRARNRYLARFPTGPYAESVSGRCR
jgi:transmembrane sensor